MTRAGHNVHVNLNAWNSFHIPNVHVLSESLISASMQQTSSRHAIEMLPRHCQRLSESRTLLMGSSVQQRRSTSIAKYATVLMLTSTSVFCWALLEAPPCVAGCAAFRMDDNSLVAVVDGLNAPPINAGVTLVRS